MEQKAIGRDTYRQIKKMSREELNDFLIRYAENLCKPIDLSAISDPTANSSRASIHDWLICLPSAVSDN